MSSNVTDVQKKRAKVITIASGKGGVGKSNCALMIALALAKRSKRVLLFDADIGLANVHILLGIAPRLNLSHVAIGEATLEDILCAGPHGLTIAPGGTGIAAMATLGPEKIKALLEMLSALETRFDFIIIDAGAGIGETTIKFGTLSDETLCIITAEPTSLADAYTIIKVMHAKRNLPPKIIVNMASSQADGQAAFDTLNSLVVKFLNKPLSLLGILPHDPEIARLVRRQKVLFLEKPLAVFSKEIDGIAQKLSGSVLVSKRSFFERFFSVGGATAS